MLVSLGDELNGGFRFIGIYELAKELSLFRVVYDFFPLALILIHQILHLLIDVEGIEPTNKTAERALCPAVIYRKLSSGTQSETGNRFVERMLTVSETCRLGDRSAYEYLIAAATAHVSKQTPPSLLPTL
ncbi:MAG: hypothetical protein H6822_23540 [Planctomycetaceae bacterium]|nr:hypothetical protein [Planctomycetales bacterium]MCB9925173.1 hypothetical protein [Planctomycetaceae bacterium]